MSVNKTIAFVDDDETYIYITRKTILQADLVEGIQVYHNGMEILTFITENKKNEVALPDLILLDLSMPIMDGWQFLDAYSKVSDEVVKNIVICVCSSSISPDDVNRAKANPLVSHHIVKPVRKEKLVEIISSIQ